MIDQKPKDKVVAILLCLFLGGFGVHNFYLGYTGRGIAQLLILIFSIPLAFLFIGLLTMWIPGIWAFIELILLACNRLPDVNGNLPE